MKDWKDNSYHKKTEKTQKQNKHAQYKDTFPHIKTNRY